MKKILLILPIRGPRSPTECHEAGEILIVTDQAAKSIVDRGAGIIVEEVENRDSGTGGSVFRDSFGSGNMAGSNTRTKSKSVGNRRSGNKKSAAKTKRRSGENPESNL